MKLLLDENLPKRLKQDFPDQDVFTIRDKGWNGLKNGELLKLMINEGFDALLTFDKNLQHQQNFTKYPITVFILSAPINSYIEMSKLCMMVQEHLKNGELRKGIIIITNSAGV